MKCEIICTSEKGLFKFKDSCNPLENHCKIVKIEKIFFYSSGSVISGLTNDIF